MESDWLLRKKPKSSVSLYLGSAFGVSVAQCGRKRFLHSLVRYDCRQPGLCIGEEALSQVESSVVFIVIGLVDNYYLLKNGGCLHLQTGNLRVLSVGLCPFLMAFGRLTEDETMSSQ